MTLAQTGGKGGSKPTRGFQSVADTARRRLEEAAARHGFAEPDVLLRWSEIVGERLRDLCTPVNVTYPRTDGLGATLFVRVEGARAPEVEHLGPRIIERVNQFYGYRAIGRLKVTQTTAPGLAEEPAHFTGKPGVAPVSSDPADPALALDPAAEARAAEMASGIRNEALRTALIRMGAHLLSHRDTANRN